MALPSCITLWVCPRCRDAKLKRHPRCDCVPSRTSRVEVRVKAEGKIKKEIEDAS